MALTTPRWQQCYRQVYGLCYMTELSVGMKSIYSKFGSECTYKDYMKRVNSVNEHFGWERGTVWVDRILDNKEGVVEHLISYRSPGSADKSVMAITSTLSKTGLTKDPKSLSDHYRKRLGRGPRDKATDDLFREIRTSLLYFEGERRCKVPDTVMSNLSKLQAMVKSMEDKLSRNT